MLNSDLPELPDFVDIGKYLEKERKSLFKFQDIGDEAYLRDIDDAKIILDFLQDLQSGLYKLFSEYPSLLSLFNKEFISFHEFLQREYIIENCFLEDCLFPELESHFYGQDGGIEPNLLSLHLKSFHKWAFDKEDKHKKTQEELKGDFDFNNKIETLKCQCSNCTSEYRSKLRESILNNFLNIVDSYEEKLKESLKGSVDETSSIFQDMKKEVEKYTYKNRHRLKRSALNRLESQVKQRIKNKFTYPSPLAVQREQQIRPYLKKVLEKLDLSEDLVEESDYHKFFNQISAGIWKGERSIERDFKKTVKAITVFKRKDISGSILQNYLGEFWVHSQAREIKRKIVYHMGPTNSGKTYHAIEKLKSVEKGCYLAPLRLLAGELYDTLNQAGVRTTLLTGEEVIEVEGANHYSSTIEMARLQQYFDCCVIDEIQMITDSQRGWAWTRALVNIFADEVHLCGDPSVLDLVKQIVELCGDELEVKNYERMTKLNVEPHPIKAGDLQKSDALIVFSRKSALKFKLELERIGFKVSVIYGRLSPEVRREQARKFDEGLTDVIVSTDAISMGMNLPIRRIVFSTLSKFFNSQEHVISDSEIKQIAGRAGRFKRFPTGYVTCLSRVEDGIFQIRDAISGELNQRTQCMVGPDLDIFTQVNKALEESNLPVLKLSEFLRLFNTMTFQKPFFCVELNEMIEVAEMVEEADHKNVLSTSETFGFACAPVNLGLMEHVQYFNWILNHYVQSESIINEPINASSNDIDYLETSIKCVELYQWLSRHFAGKNFEFDEAVLLENKMMAVDKLNKLLSEKIVPTCSSCGVKLPEKSKFAICDDCFTSRRFSRRNFSRDKDRRSGKGPRKDSGKSFGKGKKVHKRKVKRKFTGKKK